MADLTVDTTSPAYNVRRQQFADIVSFWLPKMRQYEKLSTAMQEKWRQNDPFLDDFLRLKERFQSWDFNP